MATKKTRKIFIVEGEDDNAEDNREKLKVKTKDEDEEEQSSERQRGPPGRVWHCRHRAARQSPPLLGTPPPPSTRPNMWL